MDTFIHHEAKHLKHAASTPSVMNVSSFFGNYSPFIEVEVSPMNQVLSPCILVQKPVKMQPPTGVDMTQQVLHLTSKCCNFCTKIST